MLARSAASGIFFGDYLRLLDRLSQTEEFAVYLAQLNLLRLPQLLRQVCLPSALPPEKLTMANVWVGGHSMKNGMHFDNYDNLLFQVNASYGRRARLGAHTVVSPRSRPPRRRAVPRSAHARTHARRPWLDALPDLAL